MYSYIKVKIILLVILNVLLKIGLHYLFIIWMIFLLGFYFENGSWHRTITDVMSIYIFKLSYLLWGDITFFYSVIINSRLSCVSKRILSKWESFFSSFISTISCLNWFASQHNFFILSKSICWFSNKCLVSAVHVNVFYFWCCDYTSGQKLNSFQFKQDIIRVISRLIFIYTFKIYLRIIII